MGLNPDQLVRAFDDYQQQHRWLAQPLGVIRKYGDDRGSALAGLVTFQVFLGLLPLLVVALTVFGGILEGSERLQEAVLESTLVQFPVLGARIEDDLSALTVSGPILYLSILGLVWTSFGIYHSLQLALNQVWNVDGVYRQGFVSRHIRAILLYVMLFVAAVGSSFLRETPLLRWGGGPVAEVAHVLLGALVGGVLLLGVFRLVVAPAIATRCLVPAAALAGLFWEVLQRVGSWLVLDRLAEAEDLYGAIGFVIVILFWINLLARSAVLANEIAVVSQRQLFPRRIAQPPLSEADRLVLEGLLLNERRRPEQYITVRFTEAADRRPNDEDPVEDDEPPVRRIR